MRVFSPSVANRVMLLDAGLAGGELRPVVGLARAERGHDAHAGDHDDRTAGVS